MIRVLLYKLYYVFDEITTALAMPASYAFNNENDVIRQRYGPHLSLTRGLNPSQKLQLQCRRVLSRVVKTGAAGSRSFSNFEVRELMTSVKG